MRSEGCPRLLVMIQGARAVPWKGDQLGPDLPPGLNLVGVHEKPIQLSRPAKVVYAPSIAAPSEHMLPAYHATDFPSNMRLVWGRQFGFTTEVSGGSALVLSRAGGLLDDALDKSFQDELFRWIGEKKLGFFYDCLNPNPSNGGLLHKDWSTVRAMKLVLLNGIVGTPLSRCASSVCAQRSRAVRCR